MSTSTDVSPAHTPSSTPGQNGSTHAPKYGTVIPNRIFVGGIAGNTTEAELKQYFASYGAVKDTKIIADRAGVSKGYGFVTFETQEDADRVIKKESDNLIFKDRKLNIGPAIRKQQVLTRSFDSNISPGTVLFSNGVPYTYQNGMAIFHAPEGGYPVPQPQPPSAYNTAAATVMTVPQTSPTTMYVSPQYSAYQPVTPQWASSPQWRWAQQSPSQAALGQTGYVFATLPTSPELMYAQPPPHTYQTTEISDTSLVESAAVEGSVITMPMESTMNPPTTYVTEHVNNTMEPPLVTTVVPASNSPPVPNKSSTVTTYKTSIPTVPRRYASSPTVLVKHGHKVQRVMVPTKNPPVYSTDPHVAVLAKPGEGGDAATAYPTGYVCYAGQEFN